MPALLIGYACAGKAGPSLDEQRGELLAAGVSAERIYADDFTQARRPRQWLPEFVRSLRPGDTAVLPSLDVLGSSRAEAVKVLRQIGAADVGLVVIDGGVSLAPADAPQFLALLDAFDRAEVRWNHAQWGPGLRAAHRCAPGGGRKPALFGRKKTAARVLWFDLTIPPEQIEEHSGVTRTTLWRAFGPRDRQPGETLADFTARREGRKGWTPRQKRRPAAPA